jgi:large subunit ribosomal protein L2
MKKTGGRNNQGRITVRGRGGGHKRLWRPIGFQTIPGWKIEGGEWEVKEIVYDPNRTARVAIVESAGGARMRVLAAKELGGTISIYEGTKVGSVNKLKNLTVGTKIHNIELNVGQGGKLARAAGTYGQLIDKGAKCRVRMPSGQDCYLSEEVLASVGEVAAGERKILGKAGVSRWRGRRPKVRGVAMNPVDHPHGGGAGKTSGGRPAVSPWGWAS